MQPPVIGLLLLVIGDATSSVSKKSLAIESKESATTPRQRKYLLNSGLFLLNRYKGKGEIVSCNNGSLLIAGTLKKDDVPDFQLSLSTNVGQTDFNMGYCLTGKLERGYAPKFETTHFAVVKKHWPDSSFSAKAGFKLL